MSVLLTALCFGLAACDGGETMTVSLSASNNVYSHGEQTVLIAFASTEKDAYVFEKGISVSAATGAAWREIAFKRMTVMDY